MAYVSSVLFTIVFADDTNVFVQGKSLDHFIDVMNDVLCKLSEGWQLISSFWMWKRPSVLQKESISSKWVTLNGEIDDKVPTFKFLCAIIDDKLRWTDYVL